MDLPFGFPSGYIGTHLAGEFLDKVKPKEWDQFQPLRFSWVVRLECKSV